MHTCYTYLIVWSQLNIKYYGVRFAKNCHPKDLWNTYFTSSKHVKSFRKKYGEPDIVQIRKTFKSVSEARLWEHKVLKRLKVINRSDYLNKSDNKSIAPHNLNKGRKRPDVALRNTTRWVGKDTSHLGTPKSKETREKISEARKEFFKTPAGIKERKRFSEAQRGHTRNLGRKASLDTRKIMSKQRKNTIFITDDISNRRVSKDYKIPEGWRQGMTKSSNGVANRQPLRN